MIWSNIYVHLFFKSIQTISQFSQLLPIARGGVLESTSVATTTVNHLTQTLSVMETPIVLMVETSIIVIKV